VCQACRTAAPIACLCRFCARRSFPAARCGGWLEQPVLAKDGYEFFKADFGCVTKYSLHLRRFLNLSKPIHIDFDLTVPDALFLLKATELDNRLLKDDLGVVFFQNRDTVFAHYYLTALPVHDNPVFIETLVSENQVFILSKQGIRLWPDPEPYYIPQAPAGYYEPPQKVIRFQNHKLLSPVSFGYVYRLAKAPVFLFPDSSLSGAEWRHILLTGHIAS